MPQLLFSYGTLRQHEVQQALFGRLLPATPDTLAGYRIAHVAIADPDVVATSGAAVHRMLLPDHAAPAIEGLALEIMEADLVTADAYETDAYRRLRVTLGSGRAAWVYVAA